MTAKEYLSKAAVLRRRIKQVETRIEEIRAEVSSPKAIRYDKDMIQSSPSGDALANYMIRLDHEERKLIHLKEQYLDIHEEIRNRILLVRPDLYADVLYMRYLEGKSLVDISEELLYSYIYVCKLHGRALLEFARKNPDI